MTKRVVGLIPVVLIVFLLLPPTVAYGQDEPPVIIRAEGAEVRLTGARDVTPAATGGPDDYGYIWHESSVSVSASGMTDVTSQVLENRCVQVPIGFSFEFYGTSYTQVWICADGYLTFQTPTWNGSYYESDWTVDCGTDGVISSNVPNDAIYAFWTDLDAEPGGGGPGYGGGTISYVAPGYGLFIVNFHLVQYWDSPNPVRFWIALIEDWDWIIVWLQDLPGPPDDPYYSGAAVGIENNVAPPPPTYGLTYFCDPDAPPADGLSRPLDDDDGIIFQNKFLLGDFVWFDTDDDGIQGPYEPGVEGIDVDLYDDPDCEGQVLDSDTTNVWGVYEFFVEAGTYCLEFSNIPAGWRIALPDQGADDWYDSDVDPYSRQIVGINISTADDRTQDMGLVTEGSISGQVYCDTNGNSAPDAGEGVDNVTVSLYTDPDCDGDPADGALEATQDTAGGGLYYFDELYVGPPGATDELCYVVVVDESDPDLGGCNQLVGPAALAFLLNADDPDATGGDFSFIQQQPPPVPPAPAPKPAPPTTRPSGPVVVPEAATLALLGSGLAGLASYATLRWRKR